MGATGATGPAGPIEEPAVEPAPFVPTWPAPTGPLVEAVAAFELGTPEWAIADALNAPDAELATVKRAVEVSAVRSLLLTRGFWARIVITAENTAAPLELRALCITARDTLLNLGTINCADPEVMGAVVAMVGGLVGAGLVDEVTGAELLELANGPQSWADINNNGRPVTVRDVGLALGGNPGVE